MASAQDHLRSHVLSRPAIGEGFGFSVDLFGEAEVDDFAVAVGVDEYVFGLEVAVDDGLGVQVLDAVEDLQKVELGHVFVHHLHLLEEVEELAAGAVCIGSFLHSKTRQ